MNYVVRIYAQVLNKLKENVSVIYGYEAVYFN